MRVVAKGAAQRRTEDPGQIDELATGPSGSPKAASASKARGILSAAKNAAATVRKSGKGKADTVDGKPASVDDAGLSGDLSTGEGDFTDDAELAADLSDADLEVDAAPEAAVDAGAEADATDAPEAELAAGAPAAEGDAEEEPDEAELALEDDGEPQAQLVSAGATADPVKDYLKQIGKVPLLNAEQEVELAKRIEAGLFAEEKLNSGEKLAAKLRKELEWIAEDGRRA
jgi:RNA polymerase primary sigma factor